VKKSNHAFLTVALSALFAVGALLNTGNAHADDGDQGILQYAITITNITRGQVLAPPSIVAHNSDYQMFSLGGQASPGLAQLAETPSGALMLSEAAAQPSVYGTAISSSVIPPGASQTLYISTTKDFPEVSVATMLATTTDGFMAARNVRLPRKGSVTVEADAYDAGTEANTDTCAYSFGPPCNDLRHNPATPEGYIHVHSGVHVGGGGLDPTKHDWRNPVVQIEIKRVQ
jgi:hypothetical protein